MLGRKSSSLFVALKEKPLTIDVVNAIASHAPSVFKHGIENRVVRCPTFTGRVEGNRVIRNDNGLVFPFGGGVLVCGATTGQKQSAGCEYEGDGFFHGMNHSASACTPPIRFARIVQQQPPTRLAGVFTQARAVLGRVLVVIRLVVFRFTSKRLPNINHYRRQCYQRDYPPYNRTNRLLIYVVTYRCVAGLKLSDRIK